MMKKNGFTMIELLLCLAIIGIVSAMGMTITKKSSAKAYNLFYYSGYVNMYDALVEISDEESTSSTTSTPPSGWAGSTANWKTIDELNKILGKDDVTVNSSSQAVITTSNGIEYVFDNSDSDKIYMDVPAAKTKKNEGKARVELTYDSSTGILVPGEPLFSRRDLLPTYLDDGFVGRKTASSESVAPIQYRSYKESYCTLYGSSGLPSGLDCDGVTIPTTKPKAAINFANPLKAR